MKLPLLTPIRQVIRQPRIPDIESAVSSALDTPVFRQRIRPGMRVAVAVGSRGIADLFPIARQTIRILHQYGAHPFVVAAMGSHGGATSEGQRELLESFGITSANLGVPIVTEMETLQIGINSWGEPVWWDRNAFTCDGVLAIARIKPHTDFRGRYESGIVKMLVIGLGKREGATQHHRWGWRGLRDMIPESAKVILEHCPVLGGLAVLENAIEQTTHLQYVDRSDILDVEPQLLERARSLIGRIPFDALDVLIIGELGKNYSGAGIDTNVVGRLLIEAAPELEVPLPRITRIAVLDVSPESHGNATGLGIADLTTERAIAAIDPQPFRMNNITACFLWRSKLPFAFPSDRQVIETALRTCWQPIPERLRLAIIPNTLEVSDLWVSEVLSTEAQKRNDLQILGPACDLPFDSSGNLQQEHLFPNSIRTRRLCRKKHP